MSNVTIFKDPNAVSTAANRQRTALGQSLAQSVSMRRIQTGTNGTFKRMVNGEQVGNAIRGEFNCIIVDALPSVSRSFYAGKYDPNAKATLPDCWSNLGDRPEEASKNRQSPVCATCPQNVKGSGENGGRACRYERRIAVILAGSPSGDVYQFKVPAKSLFGQGSNNVHPFESYVKYLLANGENPDTVVTNISYDLNADTMALLFTPVRGLTDEEYELVVAAQADPDTKRYIQLVAAPSTNSQGQITKQVAVEEEAEDEPAPKPVIKRSEEPDDEEEIFVPEVQPAKRKQEAAPTANPDLASIIDEWAVSEE